MSHTVVSWSELSAALGGTPAIGWGDASSLIALRRRQVEQFIADGGHAYGFSTLLGHLDKHRGDFRAEQGDIFTAHLVGEPVAYDARMMRAIAAIKLSQLARGVNGISPEAYRTLLAAFEGIEPDAGPWLMDLSASYGSGDVVPASWWVHALLGDDVDFAVGDVIALINGSYVAAGAALAHYEGWAVTGQSVLENVKRSREMLGTSRVQMPVTLRDVGPLESFTAATLQRLRVEIVGAANRESGNPLFAFEHGRARAVSNSSFLNFLLTSALVQCGELAAVMSGYVRSATWWVARQVEGREGELAHGAYFVQPPKISKVYVDKIQALAASRFTTSQSESSMVEDMGDSALARVCAVRDAWQILDKQVRLLEEVIRAAAGPAGRRHRFFVGQWQ